MIDRDLLKGQSFSVGTDGFVRVVDFMGDDHAIAEAARVSYGDGTKSVSDDEHLIQYLMRHGHMSPFEMAEIKLHVRVPIDIWRQWVRHRTANINEYSTRYSTAIDAVSATDIDHWRKQSTTNKQGSCGYLDHADGVECSDYEFSALTMSQDAYKKLLDKGVAREQARKVLTLSTYTEAYWKIDIRNLIHFLHLRTDLHAQKEIREYASVIKYKIFRPLFPLTADAASMYLFNAVTLSVREQYMLSRLLETAISSEDFMAKAKEILPEVWGADRCRERDECLAKFKKLGIVEQDIIRE